jgi:hypothetical protein
VCHNLVVMRLRKTWIRIGNSMYLPRLQPLKIPSTYLYLHLNFYGTSEPNYLLEVRSYVLGLAVKRTLNHDPLRCYLLIHYDRNVSSQPTSCRMVSSGLLRRVALVRTDVSVLTRARRNLVFLRSVRRLLVAACVVPSSPIFLSP